MQFEVAFENIENVRNVLKCHLGVFKLQLLNVRCHAQVKAPSGEIIAPEDRMTYLGTVLDESGAVDSELSRRIGAAKADFRSSAKVWNKASLSCRSKIRIYETSIFLQTTL